MDEVISSVRDDVLRERVNRYFLGLLPEIDDKKKFINKSDIELAAGGVIKAFPEIIDHYIARKEQTGDAANVRNELALINYKCVQDDIIKFDHELEASGFYVNEAEDSLTETFRRLYHFKNVIEAKDGYKVLWEGGKFRNEETALQMFRLAWYKSKYAIHAEV